MADFVRPGSGIVVLVCALIALWLGIRLIRSLARARSGQGAALAAFVVAVGIAAVCAGAALLTSGDLPNVLMIVAACATLVGGACAWLLSRGEAERLVDGGARAAAAQDSADRRAMALAATAELARSSADTQAETVSAILDAARTALGGTQVHLVSESGEAGLATELARRSADSSENLIVELDPEAPSVLLAPGAANGDPANISALEAVAAVGRAHLRRVRAQSDAQRWQEVEAGVAETTRRLSSQLGVERVCAALGNELRARLPVDLVGIRLEGEPERWYPAPSARRGDIEDERELALDGDSLGIVRLLVQRPFEEHEEALAGRLLEAGALGVTVARLRDHAGALADAQESIVRTAEAVNAEYDVDRLVQKVVAGLPQWLGVDVATLWLHDGETGRNRIVAVHGLTEGLVGLTSEPGVGAGGQAIASGRPVTVGDAGREAVDHPAWSGIRRELAVPISWGSRGRGALSLASFTPQPSFREADVDLGLAVGRLVSLALENAEAFERRGRQARLDRAASQIAADLAALAGGRRAEEAIVAAARSAFAADGAVVRLGPDLRVEAATGVTAPEAPVSLELLCARERRVVAAGTVAEDSRLPVADRRSLGGIGAMLSVPLARPGARATPGVVSLLWRRARPFADEELALCDRLRESAAGALERAALEEASRRAGNMARELQRVGALLAGDLDARVVLRQIVAEAVGLLDADACALRLVEGDELVVRAVHGHSAEFVAERQPTSSDPIAAEVLTARSPVAIPDLATDGRIAGDDPVVAQAHFAGFLAAPVQSADSEVRGMLAVYDRRSRLWRADEIDALAAFANSAAVALRNALLYEQVAQEKDKADAILGQIAEAIVTTDAAGRVTVWNAAAEAATQLSSRRVLGRELSELLRNEFGDAEGAALEALGQATETPTPIEVRLERGPREIWLSVAAAPLRDPHDEQPGTVFAIRDVSAERMLDQLKTDFVATVSHELRTPLTSIYGFAETLLRDDVAFGEDDRRTFARYIATEAERLTRLVEGLLSVTRLEAGAVQLALVPVDLPAVVREVATWAQSRSTRHEIELVLPSAPLYVDADPDRVHQVLLNLIDNAVKYSPDGGTVTVKVERRRRVVEVRVNDEGIGISERDQANLFRKFFRVDAAMSRGIRGIGLGLYLVRGFVAAMGGRIWVESEEGVGSTFIFELPASRAAARREGQAA